MSGQGIGTACWAVTENTGHDDKSSMSVGTFSGERSEEEQVTTGWDQLLKGGKGVAIFLCELAGDGIATYHPFLLGFKCTRSSGGEARETWAVVGNNERGRAPGCIWGIGIWKGGKENRSHISFTRPRKGLC